MPHTPSLTGSPPGRVPVAVPVFECSWKPGGRDAAWVHVSGELDCATAPQLEHALRTAQSQAGLVVLDLRELAFMGAAGAHVIADASVRARQAGRRLVALRGPPTVDRVFMLTSACDWVELVDVDPREPPAQALLELADRGLAP